MSDASRSAVGDSLVRMQRGSRVLREEWFVDPTYIVGDDNQPMLFVHQFVEYQTRRGNVKRRGASTVWGFESEEAMVSKIEELEPSEGHPSDEPCLDWVPEGWEGATS